MFQFNYNVSYVFEKKKKIDLKKYSFFYFIIKNPYLKKIQIKYFYLFFGKNNFQNFYPKYIVLKILKKNTYLNFLKQISNFFPKSLILQIK